MEQLKLLAECAKNFERWCKQAQSAKTFAELDEAKVEGLKDHIKYMQQLNRVRGEFLDTCADRRAYLQNQSTKQVLDRIHAKVEPVVEEPKQEAPRAKKVAVKKSAAKQAKK